MYQLGLFEGIPRTLSSKERVAFMNGVLGELGVGEILEFKEIKDQIIEKLWTSASAYDVKHAVSDILVGVDTILASVGRKDLLEKCKGAIDTLIASPHIGYYASRDPDRLQKLFATTALAEPDIYEVVCAFREQVKAEIGSTLKSDARLLDFFYIRSVFSEHKKGYLVEARYRYRGIFRELTPADNNDFIADSTSCGKSGYSIKDRSKEERFLSLLVTEILTFKEYTDRIPEHFVKKVADTLVARYTILEQFVDEKTLSRAVRLQLEIFYRCLLLDFLRTQLGNGYK